MVNFITFSASAISYLAGLFIVFLLAKIVYRLTIHPLAAFPRPKLAAMTNLYGASFDLTSTSSSYVRTLPALHAKYGKFTQVLSFASSERV